MLIVFSLASVGTLPISLIGWALAGFVAQRSGHSATWSNLGFGSWVAAAVLCPPLAWCILPVHRRTRLVVASLPMWPAALGMALGALLLAWNTIVVIVTALFHM